LSLLVYTLSPRLNTLSSSTHSPRLHTPSSSLQNRQTSAQTSCHNRWKLVIKPILLWSAGSLRWARRKSIIQKGCSHPDFSELTLWCVEQITLHTQLDASIIVQTSIVSPPDSTTSILVSKPVTWAVQAGSFPVYLARTSVNKRYDQTSRHPHGKIGGFLIARMIK